MNKQLPIIRTLLENDIYKSFLQQVILHRYADTTAEYEFKLRNYTGDTLIPYIDEINREIDHLCTLRHTEDELDFYRDLPYFKEDYVEFLRIFKLNRNYIKVWKEDNTFCLKIKGGWVYTVPFEVPILSIVSEVYNRNKYKNQLNILLTQGTRLLDEKIKLLKKNPTFTFIDYGTRRRFMRDWHDYVVGRFVREAPQNFAGTSNMYLAKKYNIPVRGTQAHEWFQAHQALVRLKDSQKRALEVWADEYRGELGIALSDTLGRKAFFRDFDKYLSKLYDGARQDSGCPYEWGDEIIAHYQKHGIDSSTKTGIWSDSLNFPKAIDIHNTYRDRIKTGFGIGTNLTNDVGIKPLQIVIKMTRCNNQPVAKISDSIGKGMYTDAEYRSHLCRVFDIKERAE